MKKIFFTIFTMPMAGICTALIAIAIGTATFIENDFGTATAQKLIYQAWWFELLILFFALALLINIIRFKLYQLKKIPVFIFHLAGILLILGAAVTRYISYEGLMPIRENEISSEILTDDTYLSLRIQNQNHAKNIDYKVLFGGIGKNSFSKNIAFEDKTIHVKLNAFYPNAVKKIIEAHDGVPIISLIHGTKQGREILFLEDNKTIEIDGVDFGFNSPDETKVKIKSVNDTLFYLTDMTVTILSMANKTTDTLQSPKWQNFNTQKLYFFDEVSIFPSKFIQKAKIIPVSKSRKVEPNAYNALALEINSDKESHKTVLYGNKTIIGREEKLRFDDFEISLSYGSKRIDLPFEIVLRDFQLERYPGSNSASSYASEVTLIDKENAIKKDYRIYMNHVLNYRGFRFFQSSYDPDEKGTILSVNHDFWGTSISYLAYLLLALGMFLTLFSKNTRFNRLNKRIEKFRQERTKSLMLLLMIPIGFSLNAQTSIPEDFKIIPEEHAKIFSELLVMDMGGRIKPMHTLSDELVRKLSGKNTLFNQNPDQIFLGMIAYPHQWGEIPLIKISHPGLQSILGVEKYAAYEDLFDEGKGYLLTDYAEIANRTSASTRSKFDKAVIKLDERVNIFYLIFNGSFLKIFPKPDDASKKWYAPLEAKNVDFGEEPNLLVHNFLPWYLGNLHEAMDSGDWKEADFGLEGLRKYQIRYGKDIIPASSRLKTELLYNKLDIFAKLISWYGLLGFILLILMMIRLFKPSIAFKWPERIGIMLIILGFAFHTFGLGMRWYISGYAPWSNGYESVIYIAWATVLAGLIFSKKSPITLAATSILAAWILVVSLMSWADPQITNLVPVLKSYWLTIHVSIITASYGFLAIGSILGLLNLIIIILRNKNKQYHSLTLAIRELTAVAETSLIIGVFLLTIGTFLGGVWANESWGRYWGWDAKETWSMVSILVYSFILHMRFIPGFKSIYAFNLAAFIGFFAIIMTYFGVNFYLSGLHSYAAGDPIPIPKFVYFTLMFTVIVATFAYLRQDPDEKFN